MYVAFTTLSAVIVRDKGDGEMHTCNLKCTQLEC